MVCNLQSGPFIFICIDSYSLTIIHQVHGSHGMLPPLVILHVTLRDHFRSPRLLCFARSGRSDSIEPKRPATIAPRLS